MSESMMGQGQFHASRPRDAPMTTKGHQVGQHSSPKDGVPTFHAETLTPGSAPAGSTYQPNPSTENQPMRTSSPSAHTGPMEGMTGTTSKDVYTGVGQPPSGEIRHEGQHGRK
ncbi:hypothetical protein RUND412_009842 [Rhizina undulata]